MGQLFANLCILWAASCFFPSSQSVAEQRAKQQPPTPSWPDVFTIHFDVYIEQYGKDWKSTGVMYYYWHNQTFRSDFIDWCLPLFDSGPGIFNNYTCSFLATKGNMYFVNHTSPGKIWKENDCCLFEGGLGATPPDWMKNDQYNGTDTIRGIDVDVWWFPGTNDPSKPCYGYWNIRDKINTPVRFFGLSSLGPTILDYSQFMPGAIPDGVDMSTPPTGCDKECEPPRKVKGRVKSRTRAPWPNWPSCE